MLVGVDEAYFVVGDGGGAWVEDERRRLNATLDNWREVLICCKDGLTCHLVLAVGGEEHKARVVVWTNADDAGAGTRA